MKTKLHRFALLILLSLSACLKQKNETPDTNSNYNPALSVNFTLQKLNALLPPEGAPILIDSNWTGSCIVRADDESGNIYNQIIIEDSTGGIALLLNENNLFTRFPIGRKIYVQLKGLYLGNYHGTPQIGAIPVPDNAGILQVSDIAAKNFSMHLIAANTPVAMPALAVEMKDLINVRKDLLNRLIRIDNIEIANPNFDNIYADPIAATSIKMQHCDGEIIVLRTSNYARFQNYPTPFGKGSITAIYTVYNGSTQLTIRDTSDMQMGAKRCNGSVLEIAPVLTIDSLRKMYKGKDTALGNCKIRAIVTSDAINKNFGTGNIIIQDGNKAMMVYFGTSAVDMPDLGDSIELNLAGATLTKYNGSLEIKNIKSSKANLIAKGKIVAPITLTIATLNANFANYESVLVKISNAKISASGNYSGSNTLSDGTGSILLYTSSSATFANDAVPTITKTFQGIATPYGSTNEIKIRNPTLDVY